MTGYRIAVIGSGYVGLVTGACLASLGHDVTCVDRDLAKIENLNRGIMPIYEPGLKELMAAAVAAGRLQFSDDLATAVGAADAVFIAVGTPARAVDGHADLSSVYGVARTIGEAVRGFTVVVTKSTVPVGTGDEIERIMADVNPGADVAVVSNPEFLREGSAIRDFMHPDRVVVGLNDERARPLLSAIYSPEQFEDAPVMFVSRRTAELTKYAANAFLAMKLAFINEVADLCEQTGIDVEDVARAIGADSRIGTKFLKAGPGFGGSCFPKDMLELIKTSQDFESPMRLVEATLTLNEQRRRAMGRKIIAACGGNVRGKTVAILGLTFKAGTDDVRESPALPIMQILVDAGARVVAFDPEGMTAASALMPSIVLAGDPYEAATDASCAVIVTEWDEFRSLDFDRLHTIMAAPLIVDLRNIYSADDPALGSFSYISVGRPQKLEREVAYAQAAE